MLPGKPLSARGYCYYKVTKLGTHACGADGDMYQRDTCAGKQRRFCTHLGAQGWIAQNLAALEISFGVSVCQLGLSIQRPGAVEHTSYGTGDVAWAVQ